MILLDFNQIVIANMCKVKKEEPSMEITLDFARHLVLNSIRAIRQAHFYEYGDMVICCDSRRSWRKDEFVYYKIKRSQNKNDSFLNWKEVYEYIDTIANDLHEHFPYKVLLVDKAEADDVIATVIKKVDPNGKHLIVSEDKDFGQLHTDKIQQWAPVRKKWLTVDNPKLFLKEHIIRGDASDSIPNILSDNDVFVIKEKRQSPIRKKSLEKWMDMSALEVIDSASKKKGKEYKEKLKNNIKRNHTLISLDCIPAEIADDIINKYNNTEFGDRSKLLDYFKEHKLKRLLPDIGDF